MKQGAKHQKSWIANLMMVFSILVVCIGIPMAFVFGNSFSSWLNSRGIHPSPNLAGGYPIVEWTRFDSNIVEPLPQADMDMLKRALAIRKFSVRKVAFRPLSGIGIAPRLNLCFEFDGQLPDPHNSTWKFSLTTIHVYVKAPGKASAGPVSDKVAQADFGDRTWDYQVIVDGLHDQARIFDTGGTLVARGVALYVDYTYLSGKEKIEGGNRRASATTITAALPMDKLGDPAEGEWEYYVLVGIADSQHPSMMLHSGPGGGLNLFSRPVLEDQNMPATAPARPVLMPIAVSDGARASRLQ